MAFEPIENYGVIGNMQSIALVGMNGSIDFMCYPEFDSPTVFAALLDDQKGGRFQIRPRMANMRARQLYLPETNILLTRFLAEEGVVEVMDCMPIHDDAGHPNQIVRLVSVIRGNVRFEMCCQPRFKYATSAHRLEFSPQCATFFPEESKCPPMSLYSDAPLTRQAGDVISNFTLDTGEKAAFVLSGLCPDGRHPDPRAAEYNCLQTAQVWKSWMGKSKYKGRWREMVHRSALLLKLLISREHGSLIAAPTFSLPESIGGVRNRQDLEEISLDHLSGYENSRPVHIGNGAYNQLQLDIYGEMMDAVYLANKYGRASSHQEWQNVQRLLDWLGRNWRRPDEGIWEVRGGQKEFLHSRFMCWVAFDRAVRLSLKRSFPGPVDVWHRTRDEIRNDIFTNFWDEELQAFVQAKGTKNVDASALLMPMMRFISPVDPMWLSTLRAIEKHLIEDTLVRRYDVERNHVDGLPGTEGSFIACSFWYVECLARAGKLERAQLLFEKLLSYSNHLGLYSEELGADGRHLGNFPQAFTHLSLISAATYLDRALSGRHDEVWR